MNVEVEEGSIFVLTRRSIEEVDKTRIPALICLANSREIQRGQAVVRRRGAWLDYSRHPALVAITNMEVVLIPDENGDLNSLESIETTNITR